MDSGLTCAAGVESVVEHSRRSTKTDLHLTVLVVDLSYQCEVKEVDDDTIED
jgi:hypothetical protein